MNPMRYRLSKLIPMRFTSTYRVEADTSNTQFTAGQNVRLHSTWWQWRDRIWRHHQITLA